MIHPAGAYANDTGYTEGAGYDEEPGYADPAPGLGAAPLTADGGTAIAEVVIARQEDRFGGIIVGSAFFGWLSAAGIAVLLTVVLIVAGMGAGPIGESDANTVSGVASSPPDGMTAPSFSCRSFSSRFSRPPTWRGVWRTSTVPGRG